MLVQHHYPAPLPSLSPPPPEYSYNPHISSPSAVQLRCVSKSRPSQQPDDPPKPPPASTPAAFTIRRATIKDASAIAHLGATVFSTTFGFSIPPNDLRAYLREAYTTEAIEADIRAPTKHIVVACARKTKAADSKETCATPFEVSGPSPSTGEQHSPSSSSSSSAPADEVIGFAQLTENTTEPCLSHLSGLVELQRLYVSPSHQGLGVGKVLACHIDAIARGLKYKAIWLGVWEGNFKAQRVYEGLGYAKVGDHEFKMGSCIQMDWIMFKDLLWEGS